MNENKITHNEYLQAKELIKKYKLQLKNEPKIKKPYKRDLIFENSKEEIATELNKYFSNKPLHYAEMLKAIQDYYFYVLNVVIKRSVSIQTYKKLIEENILVIEGDYRFRKYLVNLELIKS